MAVIGAGLGAGEVMEGAQAAEMFSLTSLSG